MFKLVTLSALLASATLVAAGGPEVCTDTTGVSSCVEFQTTKDCCAAVDQNTRFDEVFAQCVGITVNAVNTGKMVECCESRGAGSRAEGLGADHTVCRR